MMLLEKQLEINEGERAKVRENTSRKITLTDEQSITEVECTIKARVRKW